MGEQGLLACYLTLTPGQLTIERDAVDNGIAMQLENGRFDTDRHWLPSLWEPRFASTIQQILTVTLPVLTARLGQVWLQDTRHGVFLQRRQQGLWIWRNSLLPAGWLVLGESSQPARSFQPGQIGGIDELGRLLAHYLRDTV